jgi:hypothetical protein
VGGFAYESEEQFMKKNCRVRIVFFKGARSKAKSNSQNLLTKVPFDAKII